MAPLYIKYIGVQSYGAWLAASNILGWISVVDPGFGDILQQKIAFYQGQEEKHNIGLYASAGITLSIIISFLILFICIFLYPFISKFVGIDNILIVAQVNHAFLISGIGVALTFMSFSFAGINLGLLGSFGAGMIYSFSNIVSVLTIYYFLVNNYGIISLAYGLSLRGLFYLLGNFFFTIYIFYKENIKVHMDILIFKELSTLSIYNFLGRVSSTLSTQTNYFFITKYLSPTLSTIFKFNTTPTENSKILLVRPSNALIPAISSLYGSGDIKKINAILFNYLVFVLWGMGFLFGGFVLFTKPFIALWVGKEMYAGLGIILIICFNLVISSANQIASNILFSIGVIKENNIVLTIKSFVYVLILFPAIFFFQLFGIVSTMLLSELIVFFFYYSRKIKNKLKINRFGINIIISESLSVIIVIASMILLKWFYLKKDVSNWFDLILQISGFIIIYIFSLFLISKRFRNVLMILIRKGKINFKESLHDY